MSNGRFGLIGDKGDPPEIEVKTKRKGEYYVRFDTPHFFIVSRARLDEGEPREHFLELYRTREPGEEGRPNGPVVIRDGDEATEIHEILAEAARVTLRDLYGTEVEE